MYFRFTIYAKFIVSFSGNLGRYVDLNSLLNVIYELRDDKLLFLFIGGGKRKKELCDFVRNKNIKNVKIFDYLNVDRINESLNSGDISLILMDKGMKGIVVPSKTYELMAAGKPIIAISPKGTDVEKVILSAKNGFVVRLGDTKELKKVILILKKNKEMIRKLSRNSLKNSKKYDIQKIIKKYLELI